MLFRSAVVEWDFWLLLLFDFILVYSLFFVFVHSLAFPAGPLVARRMRGPDRRLVPAVFLISLLAAFTPAKDVVVSYFGGLFNQVSYALFASVGFADAGLVLAFVWLAGVSMNIAVLVGCMVSLRRMLAGCVSPPPDAAFSEALAILGYRRHVSVKNGGKAFPVSSWAGKRRYLVVPSDFHERYTHRERVWIYLHELTHLSNRDPLRYFAAAAVQCVFWFHPLVRGALGEYKERMEIACDLAVTDCPGVDAAAYAGLVARSAGSGDIGLPAVSGPYRNVSRRLAYILRDRSLLPSGRRMGMTAAAIMAATACFFLAFGGAIGEDPRKAERDGRFFRWQGVLGMYTRR